MVKLHGGVVVEEVLVLWLHLPVLGRHEAITHKRKSVVNQSRVEACNKSS